MTAVEEDIDDRFAGIDIDSLLNRVDRRPRSYGRKPYLYEAPEFTRRLNGEETVMEGQSLCLDCKVIGFPAPSLRWFKDDEEIVDHPRIRVESDGKGNYSLFIDKVNKGDEAAYRCRAENVEGSSSCYFFLSVRCKPKSKKKRDKNAAKKRNVSFPPMFSTIVEKVEEEDKLGKEQEILPPSPMTQFYYALTLKGRQTWPSFLGDWAFRYVVVDDEDDDKYDDRHARGSIPNGHGPDDATENLSGRALMRRNQRRREAKRRRLQDEEDEQKSKENQGKHDTGDREKSEEDLRKKEEEDKEQRQREDKENERRKREEAMRQRRLRREQKAQEEHEAKVKQMEEEQKEKERLQRKEEAERIERERREEEERMKEKQRKLEEQRRIEDEKREKERQREEEERKKREELRKREEEKRREDEKRREEERRKELKRIEEERHAEEKRKEEERQQLRKLEEERRRKDEERKKEEIAREKEKKKKEEEERRHQEELKRLAAEKKKMEDDKKAQEEKKRQDEEKERKASQRHEHSGKEEVEASKSKPTNQKNVLRKFAKFLDEKELKGQAQTIASSGVLGHSDKSGPSGLSTAATKFKAKVSSNRGEMVHEQNTSSSSKDSQEKRPEPSKSSAVKDDGKSHKAIHTDIPLKQNLPNQKFVSSKPKENELNDSTIEENEVKSDMKGVRKGNVMDKQDEKNEVLKSGASLQKTDKKGNEEKESIERQSKSNARKQSELNEEEMRKEAELKEKIKARQRDQQEMALKQQKQREQEELRLKQQKQKEELRVKMEEEEKRLKEKQEREQKEKRLRNFMKEKIRQEQLQRQYEEEIKKKKQREEEKAQQAEEKRIEIARRAELEKELFEVKIYKRDYSFADLRKSLETYGGGELLNPDEHKYWDDILEKHNYSISNLKSVFDLSSNSSTSQERESRSRVRRNSIEGDTTLERVKRSGSLSDLREAYTKSLDRPKKKRSEKKKKQHSEDEFMKRSSSISDLKQVFASPSSPSRSQHGVASENVTSSKSATGDSSSQASPKLKQKPKSSLSSHVELKKLAVNVAAKRASFHEMVSQVQQRNAQDISQIKERARKRTSLHSSVLGYDSYGSREIPVYKRLSSWSDDMGATKKQDQATPISTPSSQSSPRTLSPTDENVGRDVSTTSSRVRPFVYNSIRTIARKFNKRE